MKGLSGLSTEFTCARTLGRSLTQCSDRDDRTASKVLGLYGRDSSSCRASRVSFIFELKGRSASRCRKPGDESAAVIWPIRERGCDDSDGETVLSDAFVAGKLLSAKIRAMLQAFAPKSRTSGNCRLMSCDAEPVNLSGFI